MYKKITTFHLHNIKGYINNFNKLILKYILIYLNKNINFLCLIFKKELILLYNIKHVIIITSF